MTIVLTGIVASRMDVTVISALRIEFERVSAQDFVQVVETLMANDEFFRDNLSLHDDYTGYECWIGANGQAGYAVTPEHELINVFCRVSKQGSQIVQHARAHYDELHLNCYAGFLEYFYAAHGFVETGRLPNWEEGKSDVVLMRTAVPEGQVLPLPLAGAAVLDEAASAVVTDELPKIAGNENGGTDQAAVSYGPAQARIGLHRRL